MLLETSHIISKNCLPKIILPHTEQVKWICHLPEKSDCKLQIILSHKFSSHTNVQ